MTINRRAILGGAVISPAAISICKAAPHVPAQASFADEAELVRLGDELRKAIADHVPIWRRWTDLRRFFEPEARKLPGSLDTPEGWAAYDALSREMGVEAASDTNDRAIAAIDALCERVEAIEPTTFAGLRAWYAVLLWHALHPQERECPPDHLDPDRRVMLDFDAKIGRLAQAADGAGA